MSFSFPCRSALIVLLALMITACGGTATESSSTDSPEDTEAAMAPHGEGKAYTADYVCPMHCEGSGSDAAGNCPVCGMDYQTKEAHISNGHTH